MNFIARYFHQLRKYLLVVVISLILGVFAYSYSIKALNGIIERSLVEIARQGAHTVENDIKWQLNNLSALSRLYEIAAPFAAFDNKISILKEVNQANKDAEYAYITLEGDFYGTSGSEYNVSDELFFKNTLEGKSTVAIPKQDYSFGTNPVVFSVPVYHKSKVTGVLCSVYPNEFLCRIVEDISLGQNGYGFIINEEGEIIAHKDRSLVRNKSNFTSESETVRDAGLRQLAALERKMISGETGAGRYIFNGVKKYMGFTRIDGVPWSFAVTAPLSEVYDTAYPVVAFIVILASIFGLVLISVNIFFISLNRKIRREEQSFKNAVDTANIVVISFLEDGVILEYNKNAEEKLGHKRERVIKILSIFDLLSEKDRAKIKKIMADSLTGSAESNFELSIKTITGNMKHFAFNLNAIDSEDTVKSYELMGIDITDRVKSEMELIEKHEELSAVYEELAASEEELKSQLDELIHQKILLQEKDERHNLVVEASNIGIWDWDVMANNRFYSDKWYDIFEMTRDEFTGNEKNWMDFVLPEDLGNAYAAYADHLEKKTPYYECEYRIRTKNGKVKWVYSVGKALWDQDGKLIRMAGAHTDITAEKEIEEKINRLAYFDTLTGLSNRSHLIESFTRISAKANDHIALIFIDLDNFKLINDSYGHAIGDKLLLEVSGRLRDFRTDNMHISRLGGDEFAILIWDYAGEEDLTALIEGLIRHLEVMVRINEYNISLSTTMGVSLYPKDAQSFDDLLKNADTAMYKAAEKRMKYMFYHKEMNDAILERLNLRNSLKSALEQDEFMLFYQPIIRVRDRKIISLEALIRWKSQTLGMVPPAKFIPVAEESRLIIPLGNWILEKAIRFLKRVHDEGKNYLAISINISVIQLIQRNFAESVLMLLEKYGVSPESLELEITESAMMESVESVLHNIMALRSAGVSIALDDFGTGYSSLNYLTRLPINTLKIDKTFIENIGQVKEKSLLIGSIVEIGRKLGLSIVAEGVETQEQFDYLQKRRCERVQGYLFSKPIPEEDVLNLIDQNLQEVG